VTAPVTTLDQRYSQPDAVAATWEDTEAALAAAELYWLSTVRHDGRPHVTPLVAVWFNGALYFCCGPNEQKAVNLRHNQHVVLTTGCNTWSEGVDLVVEGTAVEVVDDAVLTGAARVWAHKWDGRWQWKVRDGSFYDEQSGPVSVFAVSPTVVLAFAKDVFAHTKHQF